MADAWDQFPDAQQASPPPVAASSGTDQWAQFQDAQAEAPQTGFKKAIADLTSPSAWGRSAALVGRAAVEGVASLPLMAMDAGVGVRNLIQRAKGESEYQYPSGMLNDALDQLGVPEPHGFVEKAGSLAVSAAVGSRLPAPEAASQAPEGFTKPSQTAARDAVLKESQDAGYVVPPATTNPSGVNRALETIGGKIATAQDASLKNQNVTNSLVKKGLGLAEEFPITKDGLAQLRADAGQAYESLRGLGEIKADPKYADDLNKIVSTARGAAKSFPGLGSSEIDGVVESLNQKTFNANDAVDATSILRENAAKAFRSGDKALGNSYRSASDAIERMLERTLKAAGDPEALQNFRDARQLIAKTYSVESALNDSTGNVIASKLASQLSKGKPLTGELKLAAQFAQAFPKAAKEIIDSGSVRNTDLIAGGATAALSHNYKYLLYPFVRQAVRAGLLSPAGQGLAAQSAAAIPSAAVMGAVPVAHELVSQ